MAYYASTRPSTSRALVCFGAPSEAMSDNSSIITASSVRPESSVSSRSVRSSSSKLSRTSSRHHSGQSSASTHSRQSSSFHRDSIPYETELVQYARPQTSASSSASSRNSYSVYSDRSSGSEYPQSHRSSVSSRGSSSASSHQRSAADSSPEYDSELMAVYLTDLLNVRRCRSDSVKLFLRDEESFRPLRLHLDNMTDKAFRLFRSQIQQKHMNLVRAIERGQADPHIDALMGRIDDEWDSWRPWERSHADGGRRGSIVAYEKSVSRLPSGQMQYWSSVTVRQ